MYIKENTWIDNFVKNLLIYWGSSCHHSIKKNTPLSLSLSALNQIWPIYFFYFAPIKSNDTLQAPSTHRPLTLPPACRPSPLLPAGWPSVIARLPSPPPLLRVIMLAESDNRLCTNLPCYISKMTIIYCFLCFAAHMFFGYEC